MKLLTISILSIFVAIGCQSTQKADTARIEERAEYVTTNLDNAANECLTDSCKSAMRQAKELIKDSLDLLEKKDNEITKKEKQIESESFYSKIGRFVFWGLIAVIFGIIIYIFRDQLFTLIKLIRPI